jgi:two-component system, cell cycle sensor histidine kinase and response regulator CckA
LIVLTQNQRTVLIIDDSPEDRELYQRYLLRDREHTYQILEATLGRDGVAQWQSCRPDAVLLDFQLPDLDGLEVLAALQDPTHPTFLPVIMVTGRGDEAIAVQAMKAGAQDYLIKGQLSPTGLHLAVNAAIAAVQLRTQLQQSLERERQAREELELRVQERTVELQQTNEELQQEIEERKQADQKIYEQAALIDISPDAVFVRDLDCRVLFWSKGAEHLYGWSAAEILSQNSCQLLVVLPSPQLETALKTVVETGEWQGELNKVTKSGQAIVVYSRWTLMRDQVGQPKSILSVETNITEQKQLEAQFLRAQRLESLGVLASGITHDMNNILAPILVIAQLLPHKLPNLDQETQRLLKIVEDNARRGASLIQQMLTFARGLEGKQTAIQVTPLLTEQEQIIKSTFPKSIHVDCKILTPNLWIVSADVTQLHQVLMNLCVNARDAMPNGGTLTITAENKVIDQRFAQRHLEAQPGSYVMITVSDTGTGMPPDVKERIFDPFFTTKAFGQGTGLGLSTLLGIIKSHAGFVDVVTSIGQGSAFKVYLPAIAAPEMPTKPKPTFQLGQHELILVVDDEAPIRETTQTILEAFNYRVLTANNGRDAIAVYAQHRSKIRAVLMDMMMPEMDGTTAIHNLQQLNPSVKIIATSGLGVNHQQVAQALGTHTTLPKPYTAEELLNTLHLILSD